MSSPDGAADAVIIQYRPGSKSPDPKMQSQYGPSQEGLLMAYSDVFYARMYGFEHTRQPGPRQSIDIERFECWQGNVLGPFRAQSLRSKTMPDAEILHKEDLPEHLWLYFYQRCLAAVEPREEPPVTFADI